MKPETTADILALMESCTVSAVVNAAMELGVFWLLDQEPLPAADVAQTLNIPLNRCHHWLQILVKLGLLEESPEGYAPSALSREAVLDAKSQDTWAFLARENRLRSWFVQDLAVNIGKPVSAWQTRDQPPPDYFRQIQDDPGYAERFTRMLYEIHSSFAEQVANILDLQGIKTLLDLGGGSGVVSFALLRKQPGLTAVVVDVENVCRVGRVMAVENKLENRITYLPANLLQDELPAGFDMVMLCDVGVSSETLFRRIYDGLNDEGQIVIVDKFTQSRTSAPPSRLQPAFLGSLESPAPSINFTTAEVVQTLLRQASFRDISVAPVPHADHLPWNLDWVMIKARKGKMLK